MTPRLLQQAKVGYVFGVDAKPWLLGFCRWGRYVITDVRRDERGVVGIVTREIESGNYWWRGRRAEYREFLAAA
jgi:hypothetical protein